MTKTVDPEIKEDPDAPVELRPGYIVFYDGHVFGGPDATFVGVVVAAGGGRARVKTLGLAADSADFLTGDLRLDR